MAVLGSHHTRSMFHGVFAHSQQQPKPARPAFRLSIPRELIAIFGTALGILLAVGGGSMIATQVPDHSPWLFMLAYAVPAGIVFAIFWLISRRL